MKLLDIAFKDLVHSLRSASGLVFMFGVPLLMTGMFYLMFGKVADDGEFNLPPTSVIIADLDEGGPRLHLSGKNVPGDFEADTLGEFVIEILQSEDLTDLMHVTLVSDAQTARAAVDAQESQVALIIPANFSHQYTDPNEQAVIEFYQDSTLTLGPGIVRSVLSQFTGGMSGVNIAADIAMDQEEGLEDVPAGSLVGPVVQRYMNTALHDEEDLSEALLEVRAPGVNAVEEANPLLKIIGPIMAGMMVFYAFYTGTVTAQSIILEEENHTLPRLFTTPTRPATVLTGKLLSVFLTVIVQVGVLLVAARLIFNLHWGDLPSVALAAVGTVISASAFGIFINSLLKDTKQGGLIYGGLLTVTGMIGMISVFTAGAPGGGGVSDSISLIVPQGWAVRAFSQTMSAEPIGSVLISTLAMVGWGTVLIMIGIWRFNRRYL
jgi:ABC-2 type transport system permease protein